MSPGKAARNKLRELESNTANAVGLGVFGWGFLQPALTDATPGEALARLVLSGIVALAMHLWAKSLLRGLED